MTRQRAAGLEDLRVGELLRVEVDGTPVCLARVGDREVYAISDVCTHEGASLSEGDLWEGCVQCPDHNSSFDVRDGSVRRDPALAPVAAYPVIVTEADDILVEL